MLKQFGIAATMLVMSFQVGFVSQAEESGGHKRPRVVSRPTPSLAPQRIEPNRPVIIPDRSEQRQRITYRSCSASYKVLKDKTSIVEDYIFGYFADAPTDYHGDRTRRVLAKLIDLDRKTWVVQISEVFSTNEKGEESNSIIQVLVASEVLPHEFKDVFIYEGALLGGDHTFNVALDDSTSLELTVEHCR